MVLQDVEECVRAAMLYELEALLLRYRGRADVLVKVQCGVAGCGRVCACSDAI